MSTLTPQSLHLIRVINKIPFLPSYLKKHGEKFSKQSETFLMELLQKIKDAMKSWGKNKAMIMQSRVIQGTIPKSNSFTYMPSEICNIIDQKSVLQNTYTMNMPSRSFTIHIVLQNTQNSERFIRNVLLKVYLWFHLADSFTSKSCSSHVHVYLYLTDHVKELPKHQRIPVNQLHVNTAFTTGCQKTTDIHVYRREEWFKVLMHESFHNLGLDFIGIDPDIQQNGNTKLQEWFHVTVPDLRFYETYCEMWAEIMNALFYSYFTGQRKSDKMIIYNLHTCLTYESIFSMLQCTKILNHNHLVYQDIFNHPEKMRLYKESTQVFSYYVIKCIFMVHFTGFIDMVSRWKTLKFPHDKKEFERYLEFVKLHMKSTKLISGLQNIQEWLSLQNRIMPIRKPFELSTLRMSLLEFV